MSTGFPGPVTSLTADRHEMILSNPLDIFQCMQRLPSFIEIRHVIYDVKHAEQWWHGLSIVRWFYTLYAKNAEHKFTRLATKNIRQRLKFGQKSKLIRAVDKYIKISTAIKVDLRTCNSYSWRCYEFIWHGTNLNCIICFVKLLICWNSITFLPQALHVSSVLANQLNIFERADVDRVN